MKERFRVLVLTILIAAFVLLFVGCPEEEGGKTFVGTWEHFDYYGSGPPPEDGDMRNVLIVTEDTWESWMYMYDGANF